MTVGSGLTMRGRHWLVFDSIDAAHATRRMINDNLQSPATLAFTSKTPNPAYVTLYSSVCHPLFQRMPPFIPTYATLYSNVCHPLFQRMSPFIPTYSVYSLTFTALSYEHHAPCCPITGTWRSPLLRLPNVLAPVLWQAPNVYCSCGSAPCQREADDAHQQLRRPV